MSDPYTPVQPSISSTTIIETVLVALLERKKVLIYSKPGVSTSPLLLGIEAAFPDKSRGVHYHRPATKAQGSLPAPDLSELDALLLNEVSLPAFEHHRDKLTGDQLGIVAGLSGCTNRDKAVLHWALFMDGAPDLIIEIAKQGVFFDVTEPV